MASERRCMSPKSKPFQGDSFLLIAIPIRARIPVATSRITPISHIHSRPRTTFTVLTCTLAIVLTAQLAPAAHTSHVPAEPGPHTPVAPAVDAPARNFPASPFHTCTDCTCRNCPSCTWHAHPSHTSRIGPSRISSIYAADIVLRCTHANHVLAGNTSTPPTKRVPIRLCICSASTHSASTYISQAGCAIFRIVLNGICRPLATHTDPIFLLWPSTHCIYAP